MRATRLPLSSLGVKHDPSTLRWSCLRPNMRITSPGGASRKSIYHGKRTFSSSSMRRQELQDHYKIMGLNPESTAGQIKARYYQLSKVLHPDVQGTGNVEKYHRVQNAYHILGKPHERRDYDRKRAGLSSASHSYQQQSTVHPGHGASERAKRRQPGAGAGTWTNARRQPLEMGYAPRESWHPEFRKFFDDWVAKMQQKGLDPTKPGLDGASPNQKILEETMDADLLTAYIKQARAEGRDPLSSIFLSAAGRNSNAGQWLKNRMAMIDREQSRKAGGVWERGGAKRSDSHPRSYAANWGKGPTGARGPAYSSERSSSAEKLGGRGTGEETFNSPWDEPPRRGFQEGYAKPWWAADAENGQSFAYDTWRPQGSKTEPAFDQPLAKKRDYSKGHQLDQRFEEDKLRMVANERRLIGAGVIVTATLAAVAGWKTLTG